jgi:D-alanyl-lipoteichoic acid acyltransferase DltB (MBOAT superfamily)
LFFTLCSLYFFYKACGWYVSFIVIAAVIDFNLSNAIYKLNDKYKKKLLLIFSVLINLSLLAFFKYTDFFIEIINDLKLGNIQPLNLVVPIGISFYTFENLSYTVDVYRGKFKPVSSFLDYCFFLSFFPKLVMGPIVRAADFVPQIRQDIHISAADVSKGLYLIMAGLFKKVVISDYINVNFVQYVFDDPSRHTGAECLFAVYAYAMVIYCDFSGYSDMAIGMGKWMGFDININFDSPYQSKNITEFWRRWHISLSSWLKDYLYIALGGNRKGNVRTYINLLITMLLGGLWHGASFNFIIWGGLHGLALAAHKMIAQAKFKMPSWLSLIITFHFVCFCWIFFKSKSFDTSSAIISQIFTNFNAASLMPLFAAYSTVMVIMAIGYLLHAIPKSGENKFEDLLTRSPLAIKMVVLSLLIWVVIQIKQAEPVMPIYLQF